MFWYCVIAALVLTRWHVVRPDRSGTDNVANGAGIDTQIGTVLTMWYIVLPHRSGTDKELYMALLDRSGTENMVNGATR